MKLQKYTAYPYLASFQHAVRARRGDDARAERCLRVGCDKTALRSVLGFHTWPIFRWFYQIVKLAAHAQKVQFGL